MKGRISVKNDYIKRMVRNHVPGPLGNQKRFAVLLPLIEINGEDHILYEVRGKHISQPNETSFPGGKVEYNESPKETCLRETYEELGILKNNIEIYGELDYIINDKQIIYCFVGRLHNVNINDIGSNIEVERVFTIPLTFFLTNKPTFYTVSAKHSFEDDFPLHLINGGENYKFIESHRKTPFYDIPEEILWGFTAQFTYKFIQLLNDE